MNYEKIAEKPLKIRHYLAIQVLGGVGFFAIPALASVLGDRWGNPTFHPEFITLKLMYVFTLLYFVHIKNSKTGPWHRVLLFSVTLSISAFLFVTILLSSGGGIDSVSYPLLRSLQNLIRPVQPLLLLVWVGLHLYLSTKEQRFCILLFPFTMILTLVLITLKLTPNAIGS